MVCKVHRLQCKTLHFPKHKCLMCKTRNVQCHLKKQLYLNTKGTYLNTKGTHNFNVLANSS